MVNNIDGGTRPRSIDKTNLSCEPMFGEERCKTELSLIRVPVAKEETERRARPIYSEKTSVVRGKEGDEMSARLAASVAIGGSADGCQSVLTLRTNRYLVC